MERTTGRIVDHSEEEKKPLSKRYRIIKKSDMTEKQKELMQVSRFDNKSKLGKVFRDLRKKKAAARKQSLKSRKINRRGK